MNQLVSLPYYSDRAAGETVNLSTWGPFYPLDRSAAIPPVSFFGGARTAVTPEPQPAYSESGSMVPGMDTTFYNRILVEPTQINVGNVISDVTRSIRVWNAYFDVSQLQSFSRSNDEGFSLEQPVATPYTMKPLEELTYRFTVSLAGPPSIAATYSWVVDEGTYRTQISGRRVVLFPFKPDWSNPVTETLEWMTDVMVSFSGKEQRRSLRTHARRGLGWRMQAVGNDAARFDNLVWGWQNRRFAIPYWPDKTALTQRVEINAMRLPMDTANKEFTPGGLLVLYESADRYEVLEVDTVDATGVNLVRGTAGSWASGSTAYPCNIGMMPTSASHSRLTSGVLLADVEFTLDPVTTPDGTSETAAPEVYEGIPVVTRQPNWIEALQITSDFRFATLDQQTGAIEQSDQDPNPTITRAYTWLLNGRGNITDFKAMLGRLHGQLNTQWVPTWHDDFTCVREVGAADVTILVRDNGFTNLVGVDPSRGALRVALANGQVFYRKILGVSPEDGAIRITVDEALGTPVSPSDFRKISLLMKSRLAGDTVTLSWRSNAAVTVDTPFKTVLE